MYITLASRDWCFKLKTQEQLPGHNTTAAKLLHRIMTQEDGSSKLWGLIPIFTYLVSLPRNLCKWPLSWYHCSNIWTKTLWKKLQPSLFFCHVHRNHDDGVDVSIPQLFDYLSDTPSNALLVPDGVPTNVKKWAPDGTALKVFEVSNIQF